ncbi:MAG: LysE family translocator [Rhodoblastus sp.]|jgi:threonine/homoserine/homoserine lactone efflux protein
MLDAAVFSLVAFIAAATILTITPGVDTAMVLRSSATRGPAAGAAAGLGICVGLLVWGGGAALGLTALLHSSPKIFSALQWAGAAYLLMLGVKLIAKPGATPGSADQPTPNANDEKTGNLDILRRGFLTNILNPKIGIFYASFLPQFIPHGANASTFSFLLAVIHVLITSIWFATLIALTVPLAGLLRKPAVARGLDRLTGCVFVAFGVRLAVANRA